MGAVRATPPPPVARVRSRCGRDDGLRQDDGRRDHAAHRTIAPRRCPSPAPEARPCVCDTSRRTGEARRRRILNRASALYKDPHLHPLPCRARKLRERQRIDPGFFPFGCAQGFGGWTRSLLRRALNDRKKRETTKKIRGPSNPQTPVGMAGLSPAPSVKGALRCRAPARRASKAASGYAMLAGRGSAWTRLQYWRAEGWIARL